VAAGLIALAGAAVLHPADAPAGQSSQSPAAPAAQLTTGVYHSCALVGNGTPSPAAGLPVRCWGFSGDGQVGYANRDTIGDNDTPASAGPVDLGPGRTAIALAAGDFHSCAVLDNGLVSCWGFAFDGQLGYANRNQIGDDETPAAAGTVDLAGHQATAIAAGGRHTCVIQDDGNLRCWGLNDFGQLGYNNTTTIGDSETPGSVGPVNLGAHTVRAVTAGGHHTCAILDDGTVRCWGAGGNGQLGYGDSSAILDPAPPLGPVDLGAGHTATAITAGDSHTCAILDDGSVRCWGLGDFGQLGYGDTRTIGDNLNETPGQFGPVNLGGHAAKAISAGGNHTCAVLDDGSVRCWGSGVNGELGYGNVNAVGDNETPAAAGPVDIGAGRRATAISAGPTDTCARLDDGGVLCWGASPVGQLGQCNLTTIGDDETPATIKAVDIGFGGAACPPVPPAAPGALPTPAAAPQAAPVPAPAGDAAALRRQAARARSLRDCQTAVVSQQRSARSRVLKRTSRGSRARALGLRRVSRQAAAGRARCLSRFGRTPGRVTVLAARATSAGRIVLTFSAPGSDGASAPAARTYVVKQSPRPIRSALDFQRAHALCKGVCSFPVTQLRAAITLQVTQLRRNTTYYYAVVARDNVSHRPGPRSKTVSARTR
jgi:alpha-tubulin suppressor-like RCC1 family protein